MYSQVSFKALCPETLKYRAIDGTKAAIAETPKETAKNIKQKIKKLTLLMN